MKAIDKIGSAFLRRILRLHTPRARSVLGYCHLNGLEGGVR